MDFKLSFPLKDLSVDSCAIKYTQLLIKKPSITPHDFGCQAWIADKLASLGFKIEHQRINGVLNTIAVLNCSEHHFAFCGHTDVVPVNDESQWLAPPFAAQIIDNKLYGRGVADMKGGIAAALGAIEKLITFQGKPKHSIWFLLTSDEEGDADFGTKEIVNTLSERGIQFSAALVGEPTSDKFIGDTIKVGRRGAISYKLTVFGKSGHVAYPELAKNAIHLAQSVMSSLLSLDLNPEGSSSGYTSLQITRVNSGSFVDNIIPEQCEINFNIRYSNQFSQSLLTVLINQHIEAVTSDYKLTSHCGCDPYFSDPIDSEILQKVSDSIKDTVGERPVFSTTGGTSDGRFVSKICPVVFELGLKNHTIHQVNEHADIDDISALETLYYNIFNHFLYQEQPKSFSKAIGEKPLLSIQTTDVD